MDERLHPIIETNREAIEALCKTCGVTKLEVFGSVCTGTFDETKSDVDLIATFEDTGPGYARRYLALAEGLEQIAGTKVDVLTPLMIRNPIFVRSIGRCRKVVYERARSEAAA